MSIQDDRTATLQLKLPHPNNLLVDDVARLRDALGVIDAAFGDRPNAAAITAQIQQAVADLVDAAPVTLDTLNEIAAALLDDPGVIVNLTAEVDRLANSRSVSFFLS